VATGAGVGVGPQPAISMAVARTSITMFLKLDFISFLLGIIFEQNKVEIHKDF
jgi:hypothetical protein